VEALAAILVVDDETLVRDLLRETLSAHFDITCVASGDAALTELGRREFAVLLADQRMPGMTGVKLAARARELQPHLVSILLSAYTDPQDIIAAINDGQVFRFVSKPWEHNDLVLTLQQAVERHRLSRDNARLLAELERRLHALEIVHSIMAAASRGSLQHPAGVLLDRLREVIAYDLAAVLLVPAGGEPATLQLKSVGSVSQRNALDLVDQIVALYELLAKTTLDENRLRPTAGLSVAAVPDRAIESQVQVPLSLHGQVVGVLLLQSFAAGVYSEDVTKLIDVLANGTAEALQQMRLSAHRERALLEQTLAALPQGIVLADRQGIIKLANPAAERLLAVGAGASLWQALGLADGEQLLASPRAGGLERELGSRVVEVTLLPTGRHSEVIASLRDVTQDKERDARRRRFISTISHEIRTPLSSIVATIDLLLNGLVGSLEEKQSHYLNAASHACETLHRIVDDLLDIEKQAAGAMTLRLRPTPLALLLREAVVRFQAAALEEQLSLEVVAADEKREVAADSTRLEQVFGNLLSNAIKFSPAKSTVRIELHHVLAPTGWAVISMTNQGEAIPPDQVSTLFDRFSRPAQDRHGQRSSGLGLAICRSIVDAHGGAMFAESGRDGTRLWVALRVEGGTRSIESLSAAGPLWIFGRDQASRVAVAAAFATRGLVARLLPAHADEAEATRQALGAGLLVGVKGESPPVAGARLELIAAEEAHVNAVANAVCKLLGNAARTLTFAEAPNPELAQVLAALGLRVETHASEEALASSLSSPAETLVAIADELSGRLGAGGPVRSFLQRARESRAVDSVLGLSFADWEPFVAAYGPGRALLVRDALTLELKRAAEGRQDGALAWLPLEQGALVTGPQEALGVLARELPSSFAALVRLHCRKDDRQQGSIAVGQDRVPLPSLACTCEALGLGDPAILSRLGLTS